MSQVAANMVPLHVEPPTRSLDCLNLACSNVNISNSSQVSAANDG